ncbi:MAG: DUF488 domain-containing protein [Acidimicrobiales bacterium]
MSASASCEEPRIAVATELFPVDRKVDLVTVGHGTATETAFTELLVRTGLALVIDVRSAPGSRRHPQFARGEMQRWLPENGIEYRWEPDLGGFRRPRPDSRNVALRNPSFRGFADYMEREELKEALSALASETKERRVAIMCAESLWWRCHRRLIADAATISSGLAVVHLDHQGRLHPHLLTDGVRAEDSGIVYDGVDARS